MWSLYSALELCDRSLICQCPSVHWISAQNPIPSLVDSPPTEVVSNLRHTPGLSWSDNLMFYSMWSCLTCNFPLTVQYPRKAALPLGWFMQPSDRHLQPRSRSAWSDTAWLRITTRLLLVDYTAAVIVNLQKHFGLCVKVVLQSGWKIEKNGSQ